MSVTPPTITTPITRSKEYYPSQIDGNFSGQDSFNQAVAAVLNEESRASQRDFYVAVGQAAAVGVGGYLEAGSFCCPGSFEVAGAYARFATAPAGAAVLALVLVKGDGVSEVALTGSTNFALADAGAVKTLSPLSTLGAVVQNDVIRPKVSTVSGDPSAAALLSVTIVLRKTF
jgi:hypothetical protein